MIDHKRNVYPVLKPLFFYHNMHVFIRTSREKISGKEESTITVGDVSSGNNTAKHM